MYCLKENLTCNFKKCKTNFLREKEQEHYNKVCDFNYVNCSDCLFKLAKKDIVRHYCAQAWRELCKSKDK